MEAGAAPGGTGLGFACQGMGPALAVELHGLEASPQQALKGPATIRCGKGGGQFGGIRVAFDTQFQGDLEGEGRLGNLVEVIGFGGVVAGEQPGQLEGCKVAAQGTVGHQHGLPQQGHRLVGWKLHQPAFPRGIGERDPQIAKAVDRRHGQIQIRRAGLQPAAAEQARHREQVLHQRQMLLQWLEGGRHRACLGLPFGKGHECGAIEAGSGFDRA